MDQHREAAFDIIHEYYYALPNNGYLNHGLLSCEKRYKEAIDCALIGVKRLMLTLEFMSIESNDPRIMSRINFYDEVQSKLYEIQANNREITLEELKEVLKKWKQQSIKIALKQKLKTEEYAVINANKNSKEYILYVTDFEKLPIPRSEIAIDIRYLFGLITSIYHWDNAETGSQFYTRRIPNIFNRKAQTFLNFLAI